MPRDSGGTYTLPAGNPVVSGTTIDATWANPTMSDIETVLTDSLSRSGDGGMLVPFLNTDGTVTLPGISWVTQPNMGYYRFGLDEMRISVGGVDKARFTADATNPMDIFVAAAFVPVMNEGGSYDLTGTHKFETGKLKLLGDITTGSPPTTEAITCRFLLSDSDDSDPIGQWGFIGSNALQFVNLMQGGELQLHGIDSGGTPRQLFGSDPGGASGGFHIGVQTWRSLPAASGGFEVNNTLTGAGFERALSAGDLQDPVTLVGSPNYITIAGQVITRGLIVLTTDVSGLLPLANGGTNASSASAARGTLDVPQTTINMIAGVGITGGGTLAANRTFNLDISALTNRTIADTAATDSFLFNNNGVMEQIDYEDMGIRIGIITASFTLVQSNANTFMVNRGTVTDTVTIPPNSTTAFALGTVMVFACDTTGNIVIDPGAGVTISSAIAVNSTVSRTIIDGGTACIVKQNTNEWMLFGDIS